MPEFTDANSASNLRFQFHRDDLLTMKSDNSKYRQAFKQTERHAWRSQSFTP